MLRKASRAELEEIAREGYRRDFPVQPVRRSRVRNARSVLLALGADRFALEYRGRMYELLSVGFEDGVRLIECRAALDRLSQDDTPTADNVAAYKQALRIVVAMAPRYLAPCGRLRRAIWRLRLRRNPWQGATDVEVGQLLGFFLGCRTRSRVRYPST